MPRANRCVSPGEVYHVTHRGNNKQAVFKDDFDRVFYLKLLNEKSLKWSLKIYAFCLMKNHVHFVARPMEKLSLARAFGLAHSGYAMYFNKKYACTGHLWQGRFNSELVTEAHQWRSVKYVENNPVRAGIVEFAWDYAWSSARAHLGKTYNIIHLTDIKECVHVDDWKAYLQGEEI